MKTYKLKDLLTIRNGKDHKEINSGDYPIFGSGGIMRFGNKYLYDKPSILLPRKGSLSNIQYCEQPFWTVDTLYYTEVDNQKANPYYLYSYLRLLDLSNLDSGTGVPSMTFSSYYNIKVMLPDIHIQNRVAKILKNIDDKIAINCEINRNLEAQAKQLYDYWFVQFDFPDESGKPYKSSGGEMVYNEKLKREIPKGWECKTISEFATVRRGSTITKAQTKQGNIKVVAAATDYSFLHNESNRSEFCITISSSGANAGFVNFWREPIYASDCSTVQGNRLIETILCYHCLQHYQELLYNQQIGAAQPHVYPEHISKLYIVVPPIDILRKVEQLFIASNKEQGKIEREIEFLIKQRNELLPLLMTGQVSVMPTEINCDLSHY